MEVKGFMKICISVFELQPTQRAEETVERGKRLLRQIQIRWCKKGCDDWFCS